MGQPGQLVLEASQLYLRLGLGSAGIASENLQDKPFPVCDGLLPGVFQVAHLDGREVGIHQDEVNGIFLGLQLGAYFLHAAWGEESSRVWAPPTVGLNSGYLVAGAAHKEEKLLQVFLALLRAFGRSFYPYDKSTQRTGLGQRILHRLREQRSTLPLGLR